MSNIIAEYIWIDGQKPTGKLRSKTRLISEDKNIPEWGFDGSSTEQANGEMSDCVLKPVKQCPNPLLPEGQGVLILCEVYNADGSPGENNYRNEAFLSHLEHIPELFLFGIEQEYTLFKGHAPLGWPQGGYAPQQGPFYCGVGADESFGAEIAEEHMLACLDAGLAWCGKNAEVMCGQHEFQIGPVNAMTVADDLWLARYLLYKIAARHGVSVKLDPKPHPDLNGAGCHTNFSTEDMRVGRDEGRSGLYYCSLAAESLGIEVTGGPIIEGETYETTHFPQSYGTKFDLRLTGDHETCSYKQFKYGVSDRTASIRVPLHVAEAQKGYIEDRRPCADADPYRIVQYIMDVVGG